MRGWTNVFIALTALLLVTPFPGLTQGPKGAAATLPAAFRDCASCPEMAVIPAGRTIMGSPFTDTERNADEAPLRTVEFSKPLAISKYEVTRGEYAAFVLETNHASGADCWVWTGKAGQQTIGKNWQDPNYMQTDKHPVVCVNWNDANAYAAWLSRKTGKSYRLLREAEWEYAARAGTDTPYSFGSSTDVFCRYGNGRDLELVAQVSIWEIQSANCHDGYGATTAPVGQFLPNGFGLFDMHGNVSEWVEDCYRDRYVDQPLDGSPVIAPPFCRYRGLRGGGWAHEMRNARSASRLYYPPDDRVATLGFRVARNLD